MEPQKVLQFFWLPVVAYLLGSIPWGLILTRMVASMDIRQKGSGNIGATNVLRTAGTTLALMTLAGDLLKGTFPVWLAVILTDSKALGGEIFLCLVAFSAFLGHLYPVFLKFETGGKGVATAAGCFLVLSPLACLIVISVFLIGAGWSRRASVGSLSAAAALPSAVWLASGSAVLTMYATVTWIFISFRHADNIRRLFSGTEPDLWQKRK